MKQGTEKEKQTYFWGAGTVKVNEFFLEYIEFEVPMKYPGGYIQLKVESLGVVLYNWDVIYVLGMLLHFRTRPK